MVFSRRQFLLASGSLAAAAVFASCGTKTGRPTDSAAKLSHWYHEYGEKGTRQAVERYAAAYKKANVEVKWNIGEYGKLLGAALLTGQGPDVFESEMGASLDMIKAGQVVELTDLVKDARSDFNQLILNRFSYQQKLYAIPQVVDMQVLYYRKSLLEKAGVTPPTTFEELVNAAKAVTAQGSKIGGFFAGNKAGIDLLGSILIWASGFEQINAEGSDIGFNDPAFFAAVTHYRDLVKSPAMLKSASKEWYEAAAFVNEETAMQWGGLWSMSEISQAFKDDYGVLAFPKIGEKGRAVVPFGAFGCCVNAKSKNVAAALDYVRWLWVDQEQYQIDFANSYGTHIPARPKLIASCTKLASGPGKIAADLLTKHGFASDLRWSKVLADSYIAALTTIIEKGADPATEIAKVSEVARQELKRLAG